MKHAITGGGAPAPRVEPWTDHGVPRDVYESTAAAAEKHGASTDMILKYFRAQKLEMGSRYNPRSSAAWSSVKGFEEWFKEGALQWEQTAGAFPWTQA